MSGVSAKKPYHQTVADTLIEQLAQGVAPWVQPWSPGQRFMPYNPVSDRRYRGMNAIWLLTTAQARGYDDTRWLTYAQAAGMGGQVLKREKGTVIQYWKWREEIPLLDDRGRRRRDEAGVPESRILHYERPRVFRSVVFNVAQIGGLPSDLARPAYAAWERHELAEAICANSGVEFRHEHGDRAFYVPSSDHVVMPELAQFASADGFYETKLHELAHASGHPSRLGRDLSHPFGSEGYAAEELRAEIASLMLGEQLGIGHNPGHHVSYIGHWITILRNDPLEVFRASADAERIVSFLRDLEPRLCEDRVLSEPTIVTKAVEGNSQPQYLSKRIYLTVPYAEKDQAKTAGACWDKDVKRWYLPDGADLAAFARWNGMQTTAGATLDDPRVEFAEALRTRGLLLDGLPLMDGRIHRVRVEGDKGRDKSGAYRGYLDRHPAGFIQNWKTGEKASWKSASPAEVLSDADRRRLAGEVAERQRQRELELQQIHEETARLVAAHIAASVPAAPEHPYLARKQLRGHGVFVDIVGPLELSGGREDTQKWSAKGHLLIPIRDIDGQLIGAQSIDPRGRKLFPRGARLLGGFHRIGDFDRAGQGTMIIVEGYATGASIHEATGLPVVVAFNAGNLDAVARAHRTAFPEARLIIAGDNDHQRPHEIGPDGRPKPNVGREAAARAATAVEGYALLPAFAADDPGTDWNDLAVVRGQDAFARQWQAGMVAASRQFEARRMAAERACAAPSVHDVRHDERKAAVSRPG